MATVVTGATTTANVDQDRLTIALGKKRKKKAAGAAALKSAARGGKSGTPLAKSVPPSR